MKSIIERLTELSAFDKLTAAKVDALGKEYGVDARKVCKEYGITYWVATNKVVNND